MQYLQAYHRTLGRGVSYTRENFRSRVADGKPWRHIRTTAGLPGQLHRIPSLDLLGSRDRGPVVLLVSLTPFWVLQVLATPSIGGQWNLFCIMTMPSGQEFAGHSDPLGFKCSQHGPTSRPSVERTADKAFLLSDRV